MLLVCSHIIIIQGINLNYLSLKIKRLKKYLSGYVTKRKRVSYFVIFTLLRVLAGLREKTIFSLLAAVVKGNLQIDF
jgi:hypothetical protein